MTEVFRTDDKVDSPRFSVIIPAYNAEQFIHIAIKSVQEQICGDWELIIVENGSTDNTTVVCESYLDDGRIRLLHSEKGVSKARNTGIKAAKGEWLIFLDADDQLFGDTLLRYSEIDDEYSPDLIVGEYEANASSFTGEKVLYQGSTLVDFLRIALETPTQKCNTKAVAFKNFLIQHNDCLFDDSIRYAEDSVFFLELLKYVERVVTYHYPVYRVVYYSDSAVRSGKIKLDREYIPAINRIGEILDISDITIRNEWYIFILNQLLVVLVNDVFVRNESAFSQIMNARNVMAIPEYKNAIAHADISMLCGAKKIVFGMMKKHFMIGILLAVRVRQRQNRKKENKFNV